METERLISMLTPVERKVLPALERHKSFEELVKETGLSEVEVMRALQWLRNKNLVSIKEAIANKANLDSNGIMYQKSGLPERRFLEAVKSGKLTVSHAQKECGLSPEEVSISLGILKKKGAIDLEKRGGELYASITKKGTEFLASGFEEEKFLRMQFPVKIEELNSGERAVFEELKKRKAIVKLELKKERSAELTLLGKNVLKKGISSDMIEKLSQQMLKAGSWKSREFRRYDIQTDVPRIFAGKLHPYKRFLDDVRAKFMALGFKEMSGPIVESDFWDMDALFMPQFHSARDIHQAYYVKEPKYASELPKTLVEKVRMAHEKGVAGSRGWRYKFDVKRTHRQLLRTQGTACSARMLASKDLEIPGKYFGITPCFRYDVIDSTHLANFYQVEGIVVEEGLNLKHLFGLLKLFASQFAETDKIKIIPGYFPFTEPSATLYAKHPEMGWVELGGSGIFRPEMTKPLGISAPVIAWGIGIDRIAMFKLGLKDIRQLFSHDLEFLRSSKVI